MGATGTAAATAEEGSVGPPSPAMVPVGATEVGAGEDTGPAEIEEAGTTMAAAAGAAVAGVEVTSDLVVTVTAIQVVVVAAEEEKEEEAEEEEEQQQQEEEGPCRLGHPPCRAQPTTRSRAPVISLTCWHWLGRKQRGGHRPRPCSRRHRRRPRRKHLSHLLRLA